MPEKITTTTAAEKAAEQTADTPVVFDEKQQERVNQVIREASARAGAEARAEADRLKKELEAIKASTNVTPDAAAELALTKAELASLKRAHEEASVKDALRAAVGSDFLDGELACDILRSQVKVIDGKPVPVDAQGNPRMNAAFEVMSLREAAQQLATAKPFLARGTVRPGTGSYQSQSTTTTSGPKLEDLFGRSSNSGLANKLAMSRPSEYARLRSLARERGLI